MLPESPVSSTSQFKVNSLFSRSAVNTRWSQRARPRVLRVLRDGTVVPAGVFRRLDENQFPKNLPRGGFFKS